MLYVKQRKHVRKKDLDYIKEHNIIEWYNTLEQRQHNKSWYLYKTVKNHLTLTAYAYFVTFTLKPEKLNLDKTWVVRLLKQRLNELEPTKWILNDDYGDLNNRLHFHALVFTEYNLIDHKHVVRRKQHYNLTTWDEYGFTQIKPINNEIDFDDLDKTTKRISKYIMKLTRHAQKGTTLKLWYSRNKNKSNNPGLPQPSILKNISYRDTRE